MFFEAKRQDAVASKSFYGLTFSLGNPQPEDFSTSTVKTQNLVPT